MTPWSCRSLAVSATLAAVLWGVAPAPAHAGASFSFDASVGVLAGNATEFAYDYPNGGKFKLSELTWEINNAVMAGVHGSVGIGRRFRLDLGVRSALTAGSGLMVDRDWNYPDSVSAYLDPDDSNWTDESRHPDTSLDKGTMLDLNLSVVALQTGPFSLRGIAGYKNDAWKWTARGGTYIYSTEDYGSRDDTGAFPAGVAIISYEQQYSIPYIGVGAGWTEPAFRVDGHLLFSPMVSASDSDYHYLRGVRFEGDFSRGTYLGLGLSVDWEFAPHWLATLAVEYQSIPEITGDTTVSGAEGYGYFEGGGGLAMSAASVALGAGYHF
jgi:plasminogen activator